MGNSLLVNYSADKTAIRPWHCTTCAELSRDHTPDKSRGQCDFWGNGLVHFRNQPAILLHSLQRPGMRWVLVELAAATLETVSQNRGRTPLSLRLSSFGRISTRIRRFRP